MKPLSVNELRQSITAALDEVAAAEAALEAALSALTGGPRAEKVTVTAAVADAFSRLRAARAELTRLREMVAED